jgi:hypothetical protein
MVTLINASENARIQKCVLFLSIAWLAFKSLAALQSRIAEAKPYQPRGMKVYEVFSQGLQGVSFASFLSSPRRDYGEKWTTAVLGYVLVLSIVKTFIEGGRLRGLLHQQIAVLSLGLFLLLGTTDILPSSIRSSSYRPDAATFTAFASLLANLVVIALAPREWTPPNSNSAYNSLPMAVKMKPSREEICS